MAEASSTRRREADGSMPVREANEPRERSPNVIWTKQSGHPMPIFTEAKQGLKIEQTEFVFGILCIEDWSPAFACAMAR